MQVVIDIPEELYRTLQEALKNHMESLIGKIVLNSTVLPKHGRLIDADALPVYEKKTYEQVVYKDDIDKTSTVLEAYK